MHGHLRVPSWRCSLGIIYPSLNFVNIQPNPNWMLTSGCYLPATCIAYALMPQMVRRWLYGKHEALGFATLCASTLIRNQPKFLDFLISRFYILCMLRHCFIPFYQLSFVNSLIRGKLCFWKHRRRNCMLIISVASIARTAIPRAPR